jgi:hypothetical protein
MKKNFGKDPQALPDSVKKRIRESDPQFARLIGIDSDNKKVQKKNKYFAKSCMGPMPFRKGVRLYPSKKEARRAEELETLRENGYIKMWYPQVTFQMDLIAGQRRRSYRCDFLVIESGIYRIEDVKGYSTDEYKRKAKAFKEIFCKEIMEM